MSSAHIPKHLRKLVAERANRICEYCLLHEDDTYLGCQVDHIISEKHGGQSSAENLAFACAYCNSHKGSDVGSVILPSGKFSRFYSPRTDAWSDHFALGEDGFTIVPLTDIGRATARILGFNTDERLWERAELSRVGRYPTVAAQMRIG